MIALSDNKLIIFQTLPVIQNGHKHHSIWLHFLFVKNWFSLYKHSFKSIFLRYVANLFLASLTFPQMVHWLYRNYRKYIFGRMCRFFPSISRHSAPLWTASGEEYWSKPDFSAHWITLNYLPVFCTLSDNLFNACTLSQDDTFCFQAFLSIVNSRILFSVVLMVSRQEGSSACSIYPSRSKQAQFVSM